MDEEVKAFGQPYDEQRRVWADHYPDCLPAHLHFAGH